MQIGDFNGVKFPKDNQAYFAEVKEVLPGDELFECNLFTVEAFTHSKSILTGWRLPKQPVHSNQARVPAM
jgi:hypothetical protein